MQLSFDCSKVKQSLDDLNSLHDLNIKVHQSKLRKKRQRVDEGVQAKACV